MDVDMARTHTDDTFILIEHRVDGGGIGLGASCEEEYLGIGQSAGLTDLLLGPLRKFVEAIGRRLGTVIPDEIVKNLLTSPVVVIAFEGYHETAWR
jgi:hypothetical protein